MICINANIPKKLNNIDDELKAIYLSEDTVCFYIFNNINQRNEYVEKTRVMNKTNRDTICKKYQS